jgi:hypothetical protein
VHRVNRPSVFVYVRHLGIFKSLRHLNGDYHTGTGGLTSRARRGERTGVRPEPIPCPAVGYSRETPSASDRLLLREIPAGGSGLWSMVLPLPRKAIQRQQLGRAMDRDWAGGTGRAGRSRAGKRLASFFIGGVLIESNSQRDSHQTSSAASVADSTAKSRPITLHDVPAWIWS